jgi:hypothetical protein
LVLALVRCEPVVDGDPALVGNDVAGDSPGDADRVHALAVGQAVDLDLGRLVGREPLQQVAGRVDRVAAHPGPGRVGAVAAQHDVGAHGALAAGLDGGVGRLHQHGEVPGQPVRVVAHDPAQTVLVGLDLLVVVEDVGDVPVGLDEVLGEEQLDGDAALHVGRAAAVDAAVDDPAGQVVPQRHGVDVPRDHDPLGAAEVRPRDHRVAVAVHGEVWHLAQHQLDGLGQATLVTADRLDVAESDGKGSCIHREVEAGHVGDPSPALAG